jgi:hypothetical protein
MPAGPLQSSCTQACHEPRSAREVRRIFSHVTRAAAQQIPLARIKRAMKDATDVKAVSAEASYLVARATVRHGCVPAALPCLPHAHVSAPHERPTI